MFNQSLIVCTIICVYQEPQKWKIEGTRILPIPTFTTLGPVLIRLQAYKQKIGILTTVAASKMIESGRFYGIDGHDNN